MRCNWHLPGHIGATHGCTARRSVTETNAAPRPAPHSSVWHDRELCRKARGEALERDSGWWAKAAGRSEDEEAISATQTSWSYWRCLCWSWRWKTEAVERRASFERARGLETRTSKNAHTQTHARTHAYTQTHAHTYKQMRTHTQCVCYGKSEHLADEKRANYLSFYTWPRFVTSFMSGGEMGRRFSDETAMALRCVLCQGGCLRTTDLGNCNKHIFWTYRCTLKKGEWREGVILLA